jgi:hypothetical protein
MGELEMKDPHFAKIKLLFIVIVLLLVVTSLEGRAWPVSANKVEAQNIQPPQSDPSGSFQGGLMYLPVLMNGYFSPKPSFFGTDFIFINPSRGILELQRAGSYWTRRGQVNWSDVEPTQGARNWDALSTLPEELITAQDYGFQTILLIQSAPDWARTIPGLPCSRIRTDKISAFAGFMHDIVARFSVPPYNVKYWEIWNEPDIDPYLVQSPDSPGGCWGDTNDPYYGGSYYADVLQAAYPQIKAADPDAQVMVGGLLLYCDPTKAGACVGSDGDRPPKYLEGILSHNGANDGGQYFDGISFHAYDYYRIVRGQGYYANYDWLSDQTNGPVVGFKTDFIRQVLAAYNVQGKFLMDTETAVICGQEYDPPGGPGCESNDTSAYEITKAIYLAQAYTVGQSKGLKSMIWYSIFGWRNSALLNVNLSPRPAYYAYSTAHKALSDATFLRKLTQFNGIDGYEFDLGGGRILWVLWSKDPLLSYLVPLSRQPNAIFDALGNPRALGTFIDVSQMPVYIEWLP